MIHAIHNALAKSLAHGFRRRSSHWRAVRAAHLAEHPTCAACGGSENIQVHHIAPFHLFPGRELDPTNLITLCEHPSHDCHYCFGHLYQWKSWNTAVVADAAEFLAKVKNRP